MNAASRRTLLAVGGCAVGVAAALGWATVHALRLEQRELAAQAQTDFQSSIRLALWRMDAALTPIVARESARPYFHYSAFYPSEPAFTQALEGVEAGQHLVPSPLLRLDQQFVRLYFQRSASGELSSPQVPTGNFRDLVEAGVVGPERVIAAESRLAELGRLLVGGGKAPLAAAELDQTLKDVPLTTLSEAPSPAVEPPAYKEQLQSRANPEQQIAYANDQSKREFASRKQAAGRAVELEKQANRVDPGPAEPARPAASRDAERVAPDGAKAREEDRKDVGGVPGGEPGEGRREDSAVTRSGAAPKDASLRADTLRAAGNVRDKEAAESRPSDAPAEPGGSDAAMNYRARIPGAALDEAARALVKSDERTGEMSGTGTVAGVEQGDMAPVWKFVATDDAPQLLLLRSVRVGDSRFEQGCWLDWPALKGWLESSVHDLLPGARLRPVTDPYAQADPEALGRRLAGISAELQAGPVPALAAPGWTPMRTTLVLTWGAVVLSFGAIGAALLAARELAERRGQFVSAVTHELRTPLTTFCLYSQMLADGMVTEESARREYLGTLRRESDRLTKIVENVLDYARVGRSGVEARREPVAAADLLDGVLPALRERASRGGAVLECPQGAGSGLAGAVVEADAVSVERILANLVDNACKYAPGSAVVLGVRTTSRGLEISVADRGPGIPREQRGRLFQPFERGRSLSHATTPGLGLGLALSRSLARRMGGELWLERSGGDGSEFVLRLPLKASRAP